MSQHPMSQHPMSQHPMSLHPMSLRADLLALSPLFVNAAQEVLDDWHQDENGLDEWGSAGGVCDRVAYAIQDVISHMLPDVEAEDGGHDGDDHAYCIVRRGAEEVLVDIPAQVYETGGGYVWRKRPGVRIQETDVYVGSV